jgi:hypothetical protein
MGLEGIFWWMNFTIFIMCNTSVGLGTDFFFYWWDFARIKYFHFFIFLEDEVI